MKRETRNTARIETFLAFVVLAAVVGLFFKFKVVDRAPTDRAVQSTQE